MRCACVTCCARSRRATLRSPHGGTRSRPRSSSRSIRDTVAFDRHRLAEIDAQIAGVPYETDDPGWLLGQALARASGKDPDLLRAFADIASLHERGVDVMARPGIADKAIALGGHDDAPPLGPSRQELLAIVNG